MSAATPWLDDAEQRAWRAFVETVFEMNGALEADLAPTVQRGCYPAADDTVAFNYEEDK